MAQFELAYARTMKSEGGYSYHRLDRGGETFMGISRKYHPEMWKNGQPPTPEAVKAFWRVRWDKLRLDEIVSQIVANEIFDTAVNMDEPGGFDWAVKFAQQAYNHFLYRRAEAKPSSKLPQGIRASWPGISEDGVIGPQTIGALNRFAGHSAQYAKALVAKMNCLQGARYDAICARKEDQKAFLVGWYADRVYHEA